MILGGVGEKLLHDSSHSPIPGEGALALILPLNDLLNPGVHRGAGHPAIGKQRHTVGHLYPHPPHCLQGGNQLLVGERGDAPQVQTAGQNLLDRVTEIGRPVSGLTHPKLLLAHIPHLQGGGKGVEGLGGGLNGRPIPLAQQLHHRADGWDALALGDDEGDQRLPGVLAQNADARPSLGGLAQKGVFL